MLIVDNPAFALFAAALGIAGVALLYLSWRRRLARRRLALALGWLAIAASIGFWSAAAGAELGPVLALAELSVVAWAFVLANHHVRSGNGRVQRESAARLPAGRAFLRHAARFLLVVPGSGFAAALVALAAARLLPVVDIDRIAFALLAFPLVWGLAAWWTCADPRPLRPFAGITGAGVAGAVLVAALGTA